MKPKTPTIDDTENDAIMLLTGKPQEPEISQPPSPTAARDAVLVDAMRPPVKRCPKALWSGHVTKMTSMFQLDWFYRCCACNVAIIK